MSKGDYRRFSGYQDAVSEVRNGCKNAGGGHWYQWDDLEQHILYGEEVSPDGTIRVLTEDELRAREEEGGPA